MRSNLILIGLLAGALVGCGGDDAVESIARPCEQLRDHMVDLRFQRAVGTPDEIAQHRAAMQQALGAEFVSSCEKLMSPSEVECALRAPDSTTAMACQQPKAAR